MVSGSIILNSFYLIPLRSNPLLLFFIFFDKSIIIFEIQTMEHWVHLFKLKNLEIFL
jgi:hypothetical protein